MKILLVNKFFYRRGGSEAVFFDTADLLRADGRDVIFFSMQHPRNLPSAQSRYFVSHVDFQARLGLVDRLEASGRVLYSLEARKNLQRLLVRERPQVVHLHNIYHQLSPSILSVLRTHDLPVVMTLHDYKMVCPVYTMLAAGGPCEDCRNGAYYRCLVKRCAGGSYSRSLLSCLEMYLHHRMLRSYGAVDVFISPSRFLRTKLSDMGFRAPVCYLPNSVNPGNYVPSYTWRERSIVYFGRLSAGKGLLTLIDAAAPLPVTCKVIGDGPARGELERACAERRLHNVSFLGYVDRRELAREVSDSMFVVLPSEWYENSPRSVIESFAWGKPVVGSRIGGIPELVVDGETGVTFSPGSVAELRESICRLLERPESIVGLGRRAREHVEQHLSHRVHLEGLLRLYGRAIEQHEAT
jgi:glycosyltransferase involved in cell wall biosynthesis